MKTPVNIIELADEVLSRLTSRDAAKTASSTDDSREVAPLVTALRKVAAQLRAEGVDTFSVSDAIKIATTGAQAQNTGAAAVQGLPPPTLPGLATANMGMTAGGGGAMPEPKIANMANLSPEALHALKMTGIGAGAGAVGGALSSNEGMRGENALKGGLLGGAVTGTLGGLEGLGTRMVVPPEARADILRALESGPYLGLAGFTGGALGVGTGVRNPGEDAAPEAKIASVLRSVAADLRLSHAEDIGYNQVKAAHVLDAATALRLLQA